MKICRIGITRTVLLTERYAIKFPTLRMWPEMFLRGMLANMQERYWWKQSGNDVRLCPVLWCSWLGLILIMPRCREFDDEEFQKQLTKDELAKTFKELPLDNKPDSFGVYQDRLVLLDYGS